MILEQIQILEQMLLEQTPFDLFEQMSLEQMLFGENVLRATCI
jgi:hypothetical protein